MRFSYNLALSFYHLALFIAHFFNKKAKLRVEGLLWQKKNMGLRLKELGEKPLFWMHVSSLGEFEQGRPLVEAFRKEHPEWVILISFYSASGYEVRKLYPGADVVCYLPNDTPRQAREFIDLIKPSLVVWVKYDFWLNYLTYLVGSGKPIFLISSVFRENKYPFNGLGKRLMMPVFSAFKGLYVQDEASLKVANRHGLERVWVSGDTRIDRVLDNKRNRGILAQRLQDYAAVHPKIMVLGSVWPRDLEVVLPFIKAHPEWSFILAPHEITARFVSKIEASLPKQCLCFTKMRDVETTSFPDFNVLILDTIGQLASAYDLASMAYIGGGFNKGIHNTLEPAVFGIPVLFGPHYHKFNEALDFIELGVAKSVESSSQLEAAFQHFNTTEQLEKTKTLLNGYFNAKKGATQKIMTHLNTFLEQ